MLSSSLAKEHDCTVLEAKVPAWALKLWNVYFWKVDTTIMQLQEIRLLLEDWDCIVHTSVGLDEVEWIGWEFFQNWLSVGSVRGSWVKPRLEHDHTLISLENITKNTQTKWKTYFPQCNKFATTHSKCENKDTLCDNSDDTCATLLKTLGMSATNVYMAKSIHFHKYNPWTPPKEPYTHYVMDNMWKDDIFLFLWKGLGHLKKKHGMDLNCLQLQHEGRLWNLS